MNDHEDEADELEDWYADDDLPPEEDTGSARAMAAQLAEFYKIPGNECGGSLHIISDDQNVENDSVLFCIEWAKDNGDLLGVHIAEQMLLMTENERLYAANHKYEYAS